MKRHFIKRPILSSTSRTYTFDEVEEALASTAPDIYLEDYFSTSSTDITRHDLHQMLIDVANNNPDEVGEWDQEWEDYVLSKLPK